MSGRLADKIAIVTGGSRGIGRAVCEKFAAEGATVTSLDLAPPPDDLVAHIDADVTREAAVRAAVARVLQAHGRIDILVNNAGVNA